ncbi:MAG: hypothetical protein E7018_05140 [Alphaproteobacteria bacterium]|nr:hypothetical protein [Alphaproteobacteria bacterium]
MVLQLFWGFMVIVALTMLATHRRRRVWPVLVFVAVSVLIGLFWANDVLILSWSDVYNWMSYKRLQAKFVLSSPSYLLSSLRILLPLVLGLLFFNIFYRSEERPLSYSNLLLLGIICFISLFLAQDFMQLMAASCCFSIVNFYLATDNNAKNKFIFYSFVSEMLLFTGLGIIYADISSISIERIGRFVSRGQHINLVSVLILISIIIKCGTFGFQSQILGLTKSNINRLLSAILFGTPVCGILLYHKLYPLFAENIILQNTFKTILILSVIWGVGGLLWNNNLKSKILYLCMSFFSLSLFHITSSPDSVYQHLLLPMPWLFLLNWLLGLIPVAAANQTDIKNINGLLGQFKLLLVLSIVSCAGFVSNIWIYFPYLWSKIYAISILVTIGGVLHALYLGKTNQVYSPLSLKTYLFAPLVLVGFQLYSSPNLQVLGYGAITLLFIFLIIPCRFIVTNWLPQEYQDTDWASSTYQLLIVSPLRLLGRILWLAVDFVVIERSIIGTLSAFTNMLVAFLQKLQQPTWLSGFLLFALGVAILLFNIGSYVHE